MAAVGAEVEVAAVEAEVEAVDVLELIICGYVHDALSLYTFFFIIFFLSLLFSLLINLRGAFSFLWY